MPAGPDVRYAALLRAVNLGRTNRVAMPALRELVAGLGYTDVETLLQSGNVVFAGPAGADGAIADSLEAGIRDELGVTTRVVVRTGAELADVVAADPLGDVATEPKRYQVMFLSAVPDPDRLPAVTEDGSERLHVGGREIYLWTPEGVHDSRLARLCTERRLGVTGTARNWTTVTRLRDLTAD